MADQDRFKLGNKGIKEEELKISMQVKCYYDVQWISNFNFVENHPAVGRLWSEYWYRGHYICGRTGEQ